MNAYQVKKETTTSRGMKTVRIMITYRVYRIEDNCCMGSFTQESEAQAFADDLNADSATLAEIFAEQANNS